MKCINKMVQLISSR